MSNRSAERRGDYTDNSLTVCPFWSNWVGAVDAPFWESQSPGTRTQDQRYPYLGTGDREPGPDSASTRFRSIDPLSGCMTTDSDASVRYYLEDSPTHGEQLVLQREDVPTAWIATTTPAEIRR